MENDKKECRVYFQKRSVYKKLFAKIQEKYAGIGHFGGTFLLNDLTREEKEQLGGFLQKDFSGQKNVRVTAKQMEKALKNSRFCDFTWKEILELCLEKPLLIKKEEKQKEEQQREAWFQNIQLRLKNPDFQSWIFEVLQNKKESYLFLLQQYKENKKELEDLLQKTDQAAETLAAAEKRELLAVFAAQVTGNPHYFDEGEPAEKCLSSYLKWKLKKERSTGLSNAEYKNRIYFEAGILKDELSNDVLTYGLHAWKENGEIHSGIEGFFKCKEPLKLTLKTLGGLGKITGEAEIYMVENPAVFSRLVEKYPDRTILCGNGQPKFSVFVLLDKLVPSSTIYYAGDFDPEGLQIAQNLKKRYTEHFILWKYEAEYYQKYKSEVQLDDRRIRKLDKIDLPELQEIKEAMRREKYAAYQEAMIEEYE